MKALSLLKIFTLSLYLVSGMALVAFLAPQSAFKAKTVATGSMTPAIPRGSLVIIQRTLPSQLRVGDVVTYINPANHQQTITHRIVATSTKQGLPYFTTKGDANKTADPPIIGGIIVGRAIWHAPGLGSAIDWLKRPVGLLLIIIIPGLLIIIDEVRRLRRVLAEPQGATPAPAPTPTNPPVAATTPSPQPATQPAAPAPKRPAAAQPTRRARPSLDGVRHLAIILALGLALAAIHPTQAQLRDTVTLTGNTISTITLPTSTDQCKNGGWRHFGFKNQGQCIAFINSRSHQHTSNTTIITITNTNQQTATTGDTIGASSATGPATNANGTSSAANVTN